MTLASASVTAFFLVDRSACACEIVSMSFWKLQYSRDPVQSLTGGENGPMCSQKGTLGCFAPEELARLNEAWQSCNAIPEDLHPKSFRATFGHNTNIWAFKNRTDLKVGFRNAKAFNSLKRQALIALLAAEPTDQIPLSSLASSNRVLYRSAPRWASSP